MDRTGSVRNGVTALGAAALLLVVGAAAAEPPKTIEPGKLNVALNGDMPMTGLEDGKLIGTDGELMVLIADRLGLEVVPHMMEWSAEIQSTKQGKVDIMHGAMGWIEPRSEIIPSSCCSLIPSTTSARCWLRRRTPTGRPSRT